MVEKTKNTQTIKNKPVSKTSKAATKVTPKTSLDTEKVTTKVTPKTSVRTKKETTKISASIEKPTKKIISKTSTKHIRKTNNIINTKEIKGKKDFSKILKIFLQNLNYIKINILDISLLFKNFIHWNISKFLIFFWSIILWFISIIPFIILLFIYSVITKVDLLSLMGWVIGWNLIYELIGYFIIFIIISVFVIIFSYSNILIMKVNNYYLDEKKLWYGKNDYFNIKKIFKYFNISLLNISVLLIPLLIFIILEVLLFVFSWGTENVSKITSAWINNYFSILSLFFFLVSILWFVYLAYRVLFSYLILSDNDYYDEKKSALSYVKESFKKTKKTKIFLKFAFLVVLFSFIIVLPSNYLSNVLEKNDKDLNTYNLYLSLEEEQKNAISWDDLYYIESLKLDYNNLTEEEINSKIRINNLYKTLFSILDFVLLYWLFIMITSSFYRRELI